jgi:hypothetical protein
MARSLMVVRIKKRDAETYHRSLMEDKKKIQKAHGRRRLLDKVVKALLYFRRFSMELSVVGKMVGGLSVRAAEVSYIT